MVLISTLVHIIITRSRTHQCLQLYLASQPLECVQSYKYLGDRITSWSEHIQSICKRKRKLVGLIYHQFYLNANSDTLHQFYLQCIKPHLEYVCTVRDPSGGSAKV